jgi:glycosyltransferase involved in cell wall biosynthesis
MKLLFLHQNFPGQFKNLCRWLARAGGHDLRFVTRFNRNQIRGVKRLNYAPARGVARDTHNYTRDLEGAVLNGQAVVRVLLEVRQQGFRPDLIIGHNGWGETLFVKDVYPDVPLLSYFEFFYRPYGADVNFDPAYPQRFDDSLRLRVKNATNHIGLEAADWGFTATNWQRSLYPADVQRWITVVHEGIDTARIGPAPEPALTLADGRIVTKADRPVTYVARHLEPYRGFHVFLRAIPKILRDHPGSLVLIAGDFGASYGRPFPGGRAQVDAFLAEERVDPERVVFLGQLPQAQFLSLLQLSAAHVYLTYPFVLSWSALEAMAAGCAVVGSATPPVAEVIRDGENGLLVDFFSADEIARSVGRLLDDPGQAERLGAAARQTVIDSFDFERVTLPRMLRLIGDVAERRLSKLTASAAAAEPSADPLPYPDRLPALRA